MKSLENENHMKSCSSDLKLHWKRTLPLTEFPGPLSTVQKANGWSHSTLLSGRWSCLSCVRPWTNVHVLWPIWYSEWKERTSGGRDWGVGHGKKMPKIAEREDGRSQRSPQGGFRLRECDLHSWWLDPFLFPSSVLLFLWQNWAEALYLHPGPGGHPPTPNPSMSQFFLPSLIPHSSQSLGGDFDNATCIGWMTNMVIDPRHHYHPPPGVPSCTAEDIQVREPHCPDSLAARALDPV